MFFGCQWPLSPSSQFGVGARMNIGKPKREIEIEPVVEPVPETVPMPESEPTPDPVPAEEPREPVELPAG